MIKIDLVSDLEQLLRQKLQLDGLLVSPADDLRSLLRKTINLQARQIPIMKWEIKYSDSLMSDTFDRRILDRVNVVKNEAVNGLNLNPRLSRNVRDIDFNDLLFNDWGINHLHLGSNLEDDGSISRTDDLLFLIVQEPILYFIDVLPHKCGFTATSLLETIHRNWPDLLSPFTLQGVLASKNNPTDKEIKQLRKSGVQIIIGLSDGCVYGPRGGGYSTAGTNVRHTMQASAYLNWIRRLESAIPLEECAIRYHIMQLVMSCPAVLCLKLTNLMDDHIVLIEALTKCEFICFIDRASGQCVVRPYSFAIGMNYGTI